jgi:hypothetical protein
MAGQIILSIALSMAEFIAISIFLGRFSSAGWASLEEMYQTEGDLEGLPFITTDVWINKSHYPSLRIYASEEGLYLSMFLYTITGHQPLFIPWPEIALIDVFKKKD